MNEQVVEASKKRVKKDDSFKGEINEEEGTRKRKLGIRKNMKSKKRKFTSKDHEELRLCLTIVSDEDKEVNYEILDKKYPIIQWRSEYLTTKLQYDETKEWGCGGSRGGGSDEHSGVGGEAAGEVGGAWRRVT
ncbi:hypothetical protein Tco_1541148 [Tanacetum coccineum]